MATLQDLTALIDTRMGKLGLVSRWDVAQRAGIGRRTIQYLESGAVEPRAATIQALALALGVAKRRVRAACEQSRKVALAR